MKSVREKFEELRPYETQLTDEVAALLVIAEEIRELRKSVDGASSTLDLIHRAML